MNAIAIIGILGSLSLAFLVSSKKKAIKIRPIVIMILIQFVFAGIFLHSAVGDRFAFHISNIFEGLMLHANNGVSFVFGTRSNSEPFVFFYNVLLPIIFVSTLIGILQHFKILPLIIRGIGALLEKINGLGKLESYNAVAAVMLGQNEVWISTKKQLDILPEHRMFVLCASAMSTVSLSILGAYIKLIDAKYVVTAVVLNLFGGFIIGSIISPYTLSAEEDSLGIKISEDRQSFFEMLGEYIMDGFKISVIVCAMLIGFVALISFINAGFTYVFGLSFQEILGYIFAPFSFLMGVSPQDVLKAGNIMGTKLATNEFVAMMDLQNIKTVLTPHSVGVLSVFLVSFANFSSIGIISGAIKGLNEHQSNVVARFGLKLLYGASLVSMLSASIASFFI